MNYELTV